MIDFLKAVASKTNARMIHATFTNGETITYTEASLNLLMTDRDIDYITDAETGEVIFCKV